jgi:iron complex transport system permease protein
VASAVGSLLCKSILSECVMAGRAVSVAGTAGFVDLIAPNSARLFVGGDHGYPVPSSAIFGGVLLTVPDTMARTTFQPVELSVGMIISTLGAPFFISAASKRSRESSMHE